MITDTMGDGITDNDDYRQWDSQWMITDNRNYRQWIITQTMGITDNILKFSQNDRYLMMTDNVNDIQL